MSLGRKTLNQSASEPGNTKELAAMFEGKEVKKSSTLPFRSKVPGRGRNIFTLINRNHPPQRNRRENYYITDTFERRECAKFVPVAPDRLDRCKCGHKSKSHLGDECFGDGSETPDTPWDADNDTIALPTNAYGEINFMSVENDVLPLYLRCKIETDVSDLSRLFLEKWSLPPPHLIISVFGGHSKFDSTVIESLNDIKNGLVKAAQSTQAWIFTSGVNAGVSNLVGDAIANKRSFINSIPLIGVNSWGAVSHNHQLVDEYGLFPAHYHYTQRDVDAFDLPVTERACHMSLEHEHTHFILLDKGTKYNFHENEVRLFRIKLQQEIVKKTKAQLISILMEGGVGSLQEAKMRIDAKLPLVILGNSGRISDVICLAHEKSELVDSSDGQNTVKVRQLLSEEDRRTVQDKLAAAIPKKTEEEYIEYMALVEGIIAQDKLLTIWYCGEDDDLDKTILKGLIRSLSLQAPKPLVEVAPEDSHQQRTRSESIDAKLKEQKNEEKQLLTRQLQLAIQWDRLDIANEYIFKNMVVEEDEMNDLLWLAIVHKRVSFVRNMIDRGAKIKSFLTEEKFEDLLNLMPSKTLLHRLMLKECQSDPHYFLYEDLQEVLYYISNGVYKCPGKKEKSRKLVEMEAQNGPAANSFIDKLKICKPGAKHTRQRYVYIDEESKDLYKYDSDRKQQYAFEDPEHLLVIYFTLIHETEMAKLFWEYSRTPLFLALVCNHIHKWMAGREKFCTEITSDLAIKLTEYATEYEELGLNILVEASENYPEKLVNNMLTHQYPEWGNLTALEMADYTEAITIIAHTSVQDYIEAEWKGWLDPDIGNFKIFISIFCPLLASYKKVKEVEKPQALETGEPDSNKERMMKRLSRRQSFISRQNLGTGEQIIKETPLPLLTRCKYFYKAPVTKFMIYMIMYIAFLFAYVCALLLKEKQADSYCKEHPISLTGIFNCRLSRTEALVYIWVFSLMPLEIRQIYFSYPTTLMGKLKGYIANVYNKNDIMCVILILSAFFIRYPELEGASKLWAESIYRFMFSLGFMMYCLRLCQAMAIDKNLGPKVLMMQWMLVDLVFFIGLVAMFVVAYGVSTTALINPNKMDHLSFDLIFKIFWRPYVNLYGDFGDDDLMTEMDGQYCKKWNVDWNNTMEGNRTCDVEADDFQGCADKGDHVCVFNQYLVKVFLAVYMMLAAVLMLNLLVAVFSSTYSYIEGDSETLWKWQRFDLMNEFKSRSPLPVPLCTIMYIGRFIRFLIKKTCGRLCCRTCFVKKDDDSQKADEHERVKVALLETECKRNYLEKKNKKKVDVLQTNMKVVMEHVENIDEKIKGFETAMQSVIDSNLLVQLGRASVASSAGSRASTALSPNIGQFNLGLDECDLEGDELIPMIEADSLATTMSAMEDDPMEKYPNDSEKTPEPARKESRRESSNARQSSMRMADLGFLLKIAKRCRKTEYPGTTIRRAFIKKEHWDWRHPLLKYKPVTFSDASLPVDMKPGEIMWNDNADGDERRSYEGKYLVQNSLSLNPGGRTGLSGRGLLTRWGPNHIALPIITRYARNETGDKTTMAGKHVLEVLLQIRENDVHSLPEIKGARDDALPDEVKALFAADNVLGAGDNQQKTLRRIGKIFNAGVLVYKGYLDSEYNTDNSWLESIIVSYHDSNDNTFHDVVFPASSSYQWCKIKNWTVINNTYREFLQRAFYARNAYDYITFPENSPITHMFG